MGNAPQRNAPQDELDPMRALVAEADRLRAHALELMAAVERNVAELARVRNSLFETARRRQAAAMKPDP